jgi:hypothetical protein
MSPVKILASRYNDLLNFISAIMGDSVLTPVNATSGPTVGYGQTLNATPVDATTSKITAQQYEEIYIDLVRARVHQVGAASFTIDPFVVGDYDTNGLSTDKVEEVYIQTLENLMAQIVVDKDLVDLGTELGLDVGGASTRLESISGSWNGQLFHIFDMEFTNAAHRRHFFNAGGEIRITPSMTYGGADLKSAEWLAQINSIGAVSIQDNATINRNGVGSGTLIGNYQLTGTYSTLYEAFNTSSYTDNVYRVQALSLNDSTIRIRCVFEDSDSPLPPGIDEDVFGDITNTAESAPPEGSVNINGTDYDTVVVASPTYTLVTAI